MASVKRRAVINHGKGGTVLVVQELHHRVTETIPDQLVAGVQILMDHAVHCLRGADAVQVVGVGNADIAVGSGGQFPAVLPPEGPPGAVVVADGIAADRIVGAYGNVVAGDGIGLPLVGDLLPVIGRQQVLPGRVAVGIALSPSGENIAVPVVGVVVGGRCAGIVGELLLRHLAQRDIDIRLGGDAARSSMLIFCVSNTRNWPFH